MNNSIRCFIAIELVPEIQKQLDDMCAPVRHAIKTGLRWVQTNNIHLTLKFLGDVPRKDLPKMSDELVRVASLKKVFNLELRRFGVFPSARQPRIFWIGVQAPPVLFDLQKDIENALEVFGIPKESRPFAPHLTLARSNEALDLEGIRILNELIGKENSEPKNIPVSVRAITFFQSDLRPGGPIYTPLKNANLRTI